MASNPRDPRNLRATANTTEFIPDPVGAYDTTQQFSEDPARPGAGVAQQTPADPTHQPGSIASDFGAGTGTDTRYADTQGTGHPKMGDKIMGGGEKLAGSVLRNPNLKEKGEEKKEGGYSISGGDYGAQK